MKKTTTITAMIGGLALAGAATAHAQAPPESVLTASISVGSQVQERTFTVNNTIHVFGEDGTVTANQVVGRGLLFDASAAYRLGQHLAIALGVSTFKGKGNAAAVAAVPDQLLFGTFRNTTFSVSDLRQTDIALNLQLVWMMRATDKIDLAIFVGPSAIHVKQDLASVIVNTTTQAVTASIDSQSKTTFKAGTVGADFSYRLTDKYGAGVFVRYAGGEVNLPAAPKLKIGGLQVGAGLRVRF